MSSKLIKSGFQTQKKSALLAQQIVNEIVDGSMQPGDRLPAEADMGAHYGVGRSTVREALRQLESQGVLRIKTGPGGGPVVREFDASFLAANMALHLQLSGASFRDVLDALLVIEPGIAGATAERRNPEVLAGLEQAMHRMREPSADGPDLVTAAAAFHDLLAEGANNPLFEHLMLAIHHISEPFVRRFDYAGAMGKRLVSDHEKIYNAIVAGDRLKATNATRQRVATFVAYVEAEIPHLLDEPVDWGRITSPT